MLVIGLQGNAVEFTGNGQGFDRGHFENIDPDRLVETAYDGIDPAIAREHAINTGHNVVNLVRNTAETEEASLEDYPQAVAI